MISFLKSTRVVAVPISLYVRVASVVPVSSLSFRFVSDVLFVSRILITTATVCLEPTHKAAATKRRCVLTAACVVFCFWAIVPVCVPALFFSLFLCWYSFIPVSLASVVRTVFVCVLFAIVRYSRLSLSVVCF